MRRLILTASIAAMLLCSSAIAVDNLLVNPGFREVFDPPVDAAVSRPGWTNSGDVFYFEFFGPNPHASFFADTIFHQGRLEQEGIVAIPGTTYQFDMMDLRIEANFSPDFEFGLEYYDAGDSKIGETIVPVDYATRLTAAATAGTLDGGGAVNGAVFSVQGTAPAGTATVRPVMQYDNVTVPGNQTNAFLFNTHMSAAPGVGDEALKNAGFEDTDGDGFVGDFWGSFGAASFDDFFSGGGAANGHASLFGDMAGNEGGVFQQSILGIPGTEYEFNLTDVRIETNVNGNYEFGFEFYGDDDTTLLGDSFDSIDLSTTGDGLSFTTSAVAIAGTTYIRPVVKFSDVLSTSASDASVFIFDASVAELSSTLEDADFDDDMDVDGNDFLIWQRGFGTGTTNAAGDANGDMMVTAADLAIWESQYGSPSALSAIGVPEPQSLILVVTAVTLISATGNRRRV